MKIKNKELLNLSRNLKIYKKKMTQKKNRQKAWVDISQKSKMPTSI